MRLPKRIAEILKRKQDYIDSQRSKLESSVLKLQSELFSKIIAGIIPELDMKDGVIQDTAKNYRLISVLDKTYKSFQTETALVLFSQIKDTTANIAELSTKYYKLIFESSIPERFESVIEKTNKLIDLKIGVEGGKLQRTGVLQSFFESNLIGTELKQMTSKAVASNMDQEVFVKALKDTIVGHYNSAGSLERQFQRFGYDLYQQYDAAYNLTLGNEFGFNYFIYQGGLVNDSRDFCAAHNNKVWSIEEAKTWVSWTPSMGEYPAGYAVKAKDIYSVPSYMNYPGYDPMIDRGGYNCRHAFGWIPDDMAFQMRPELKNNQE
jgi:hypothetical protein